MTCPACHAVNEDDARFCAQCGHPLEISCPACGSQTAAGARFCRKCGQHLGQSPGPQPSSRLWSLDDKLSHRQLIAAGKSNRDIADTLCISLNTVATHVRNILAKTGCSNRTEAAAYALHHGVPEG